MDVRKAMHFFVVAQRDSIMVRRAGASVGRHGYHPDATTASTLILTDRPVTEFSEYSHDRDDMHALAEFSF